MVPEIKLKESTINEALVKAGLGVAKDGTVAIPENLYDDSLVAAGLDPKTNRKYQEHRTGFIAQAAHTLGAPALTAMEQNKEINNITANIPAGHDKISISIDRTRETSDGKGGRMEQHGYLTVGYTAVGAGTSKGELKKTREHLKQIAIARLGA